MITKLFNIGGIQMPIEYIDNEEFSFLSRSVFISHSSSDKSFVHKLADVLKKNGLIVWVDENELRIGDDFWMKIQNAIYENDHLIMIISKKSIRSSWVNKEISIAEKVESETSRKVLIPVLIDDIKIPKKLSKYLFADFRKSFKKGMDQLFHFLTEVEVNSYDFPSGYVRSNARRGNIGGRQRIINLSVGGAGNFINILIEGIGPVDAAYEATSLIHTMTEVLIREAIKKEWYFDEVLMNLFFVNANSCMIVHRLEKDDPRFDVTGVKMCVAMIGNDLVSVSSVGSTGILVRNENEEGLLYTAVNSKNQYYIEAPLNCEYLFNAPIGFIKAESVEDIIIDIQQFPFKGENDFVALSTFPLPRDEKMLKKILSTMHKSEVPNGIAYELCRWKTPKGSNCLVSVISP